MILLGYMIKRVIVIKSCTNYHNDTSMITHTYVGTVAALVY
jgi:hypothetical protein